MKSRPPLKKSSSSPPPRTTLRGHQVDLDLLPSLKFPPEPAPETSVSILTELCRSLTPMPFAAVVRNTRLPREEAAAAIDYLARLGILVRIDEQDLYDLEPSTRALKRLTGNLSKDGLLALQESLLASFSMPLDKIKR